MRRLTIAMTLSAALCLAGPVAAAPAKTLGPLVLGFVGKKEKPKLIGVGAKGEFQNLRWRNWGKANAYTKGVYDIAGFAGEPGTGYRGSVSIRVYGLKNCGGGRSVYTRIRYRVKKSIGGRKLFAEKFATCS